MSSKKDQRRGQALPDTDNNASFLGNLSANQSVLAHAVPGPRMRTESGAAQRRTQNRKGSVLDGSLSYEHVVANVDSPRVTQGMTCGDLSGWLENRGRADVIRTIQDHQLDGTDLLEMSAVDLAKELGAEDALALYNTVHGIDPQ